jgi:hypothetical protein
LSRHVRLVMSVRAPKRFSRMKSFVIPHRRMKTEFDLPLAF